MSKECKRCKKEINDDVKYCSFCGKKQDMNLFFRILRFIFIGKSDTSSIVNFIVLSMSWCFAIFGIIIFIILINQILNGLFQSFWYGLLYSGGCVAVIIYCARCCVELAKLLEKASKNTEEGKEYRALLVNIFSGFMAFFAMMLALMSLYI